MYDNNLTSVLFRHRRRKLNPITPILRAAETLSHLIGQASPQVVEPLEVDTFIARSAMQKAIRRGLSDLALSSGLTLLSAAPEVLWRRLLVIALEDVGPFQLDFLNFVLAAAQGIRFRAKIGPDWDIARALIVEACQLPKCQVANDLRIVAERDPAFDHQRNRLKDLQLYQLVDIIAEPGIDLMARAGITMRVFDELKPGPGAEIVFQRLADGVEAESIQALYEAWRRTGLSLSPLSVLLLSERAEYQAAHLEKIPLLPVCWVKGAPGFALDQYTRSGRTALRNYVGASRRWKRFGASLSLSTAQQERVAGELLFRAEGSLVASRRAWATADELAARSKMIGCYVSEHACEAGLALVQSELPLIQCLRHAAYRKAA